jgi:hypothetical protein
MTDRFAVRDKINYRRGVLKDAVSQYRRRHSAHIDCTTSILK